MSIRRRTWTTRRGEDREAWIADYFDQNGERHIKTFKLKSEAKEFASRTHVEVKEGIHVADSATVTVGEAASYWLDSCKERDLEPSSIARNSQHVELHIKPFLGKTKLSKLSIPAVRAFQTKLSEEGRSPAMVKGVLVSLSSILTDAQERGLAIRNPVRELSRSRKGSRSNGRDKIQVGVDIPTPREIKIVTEGAKNLRHKVSIMVLATTGLRASEFRALQWPDLDLVHNELHVRRRADDKNRIGPPKSSAGTRTIPLIPQVVAVLKQWKKECPTKDGELLYVFPNGNGNIENYGNVADRIWERAQLDAGVTVPATDEDGNVLKDDKGQPLMAPKYTGLHALRHFFISWCINRKKDGGLELLPKTVQERAGHSDIKLLFDTYGHLFPRANDKAELTKAGSKLFG